MEKRGNIIIAVFVIFLGVLTIFKIVPNIELAIGFMTISFGLLAIIWTSMAVRSLSKGSSLRNYTTNFLFCLIFILLFSIWNTMSIIFHWRYASSAALLYPGYAFIALSFLTFVWTSYKILQIGKEFGFGEQAVKIENRIKDNRASKKARLKLNRKVPKASDSKQAA